MSTVRLIKHEAVPRCGSFEVRFSDGTPSQYFYLQCSRHTVCQSKEWPPRDCARPARRSKSIEAGVARPVPVIALVAIALRTIAPAMVKPIAHHAVFFMALRKPPAASVPWGEGRKRRVRDTRH